mmetsp:Transcript_7750/g.18874  ORF Transcript_7750/g.18874 Transcript_7750/m.18874 type:complete len:201 (-) Transcript_7750:126-728(-)
MSKGMTVSLVLGLVAVAYAPSCTALVSCSSLSCPSLRLRGGSDPYSAPPPSGGGAAAPPGGAADWSSPSGAAPAFSAPAAAWDAPAPSQGAPPAEPFSSAPPAAAPKFVPPPSAFPPPSQKSPPKFVPPAAAPGAAAAAPSAVQWDQNSNSLAKRFVNLFGWDNISPILCFAVGVALAWVKAVWHGSGEDDAMDLSGVYR